jgi:hypothetical protein
VDTENKIRAVTGDEKRTTYGGGEITDADFDKYPGHKADKNNSTQGGCSQ